MVIRTDELGSAALQHGAAAADASRMRVSILAYGVLYVVLEMVLHHLETVGWARVTALDVAAALVDALLAIVVAIAVLVLVDVARTRWGPRFRAWQARQLRANRPAAEPIGVESWRPTADAFAPPRAIGGPGGTYGPSRPGHRYPEDPGLLL